MSSDFADQHIAGKYRNLDLNLGPRISLLLRQPEDDARDQKEGQHGDPSHHHQRQKSQQEHELGLINVITSLSCARKWSEFEILSLYRIFTKKTYGMEVAEVRSRDINKPQFTRLNKEQSRKSNAGSQTSKFSHCSPVSAFSVRQPALTVIRLIVIIPLFLGF